MVADAALATEVVDLAVTPLRELNQLLHKQTAGTNETQWEVLNPKGQHAIAVGVVDGPAPSMVGVAGSGRRWP